MENNGRRSRGRGDSPGVAKRGRSAWRLAWVPVLAVAGVLVLPPAARAADPGARSATLARLGTLETAGAPLDLRAWVNDGSGRTLRLGEELEYHFQSNRDGYLTVLHIDPHGVVTVLYPSALPQGNQLVAGVVKTFPGPSDGFSLTVDPPLGLEDLYAMATPQPIDPDALGLEMDAGPLAVVDAGQTGPLLDRLAAELAARWPQGVAIAQVQQRSAGRGDAAEYSASDIVTYFTTRPRAIRRPRLDLHVRFATGSAELDERARQSLDEIGAALDDPSLGGLTFVVGGHTDDVGTEAYNLDLSRRRAEAVRSYLTRAHGVEAERLGIRAYGESAPLEPEHSQPARALNRRVEFELER